VRLRPESFLLAVVECDAIASEMDIQHDACEHDPYAVVVRVSPIFPVH
jgi:hypothetical protein